MTTFPGIAGEIEALIGVEATTALLRRWGGMQAKFPQKAAGSVLAETVGLEAAEILIRELGPGFHNLPCASMRGQRRRRDEALAMLRAGASVNTVARECDMHSRTVHRLRSELDEASTRQISLPFDRD